MQDKGNNAYTYLRLINIHKSGFYPVNETSYVYLKNHFQVGLSLDYQVLSIIHGLSGNIMAHLFNIPKISIFEQNNPERNQDP